MQDRDWNRPKQIIPKPPYSELEIINYCENFRAEEKKSFRAFICYIHPRLSLKRSAKLQNTAAMKSRAYN